MFMIELGRSLSLFFRGEPFGEAFRGVLFRVSYPMGWFLCLKLPPPSITLVERGSETMVTVGLKRNPVFLVAWAEVAAVEGGY